MTWHSPTTLEKWRRLDQVTEFVRILQTKKTTSRHNIFFDVRPSLKRIRVEGMYLMNKSLTCAVHWKPYVILYVSYRKATMMRKRALPPSLKDWQGDITVSQLIQNKRHPLLTEKSRTMPLQNWHASAGNWQVLWEASPLTEQHSTQMPSPGVVDKDVTPTMRDGRLVIPVAPALKRKIRGIVPRRISQWKTVFIEPAEVVGQQSHTRT